MSKKALFSITSWVVAPSGNSDDLAQRLPACNAPAAMLGEAVDVGDVGRIQGREPFPQMMFCPYEAIELRA